MLVSLHGSKHYILAKKVDFSTKKSRKKLFVVSYNSFFQQLKRRNQGWESKLNCECETTSDHFKPTQIENEQSILQGVDPQRSHQPNKFWDKKFKSSGITGKEEANLFWKSEPVLKRNKLNNFRTHYKELKNEYSMDGGKSSNARLLTIC